LILVVSEPLLPLDFSIGNSKRIVGFGNGGLWGKRKRRWWGFGKDRGKMDE
jgi:hypothetical protein